MIRFDFPGLSPGMCFALSWLIDRGGAIYYRALLEDIKPDAKAEGRIVSRSTVNGLLNRGYLEESDDMRRVQVPVDGVGIWGGAWPIIPVMRARAEALAHRENANRVADMIKDAWDNRNTEGDDV